MPAAASLRSERETPDRAAQQSYREELERQVSEKRERRGREKVEREAFELKQEIKLAAQRKQLASLEEVEKAGSAGAADKENATGQKAGKQTGQQARPPAESSKPLSTTEQPDEQLDQLPDQQPAQDDSHDRPPGRGTHERTQLDRQPHDPAHLDQHSARGRLDPPTHMIGRQPQAARGTRDQPARATHDPAHLHRQLEVEQEKVRRPT